MPDTQGTPVGYVLCDDLMFTSRITGTARDLGLTMKAARSREGLEKLIAQQCPSCVLIDLSTAGADLGTLIGRLKELCAPRPRLVAYGSHVDTATLRAAREAGCDPVLPRSKFVEELPRALAQWLQPCNSDQGKTKTPEQHRTPD